MTTWKALIEQEMKKHGETYADIVYANAVPNYRQEMWKDTTPEELEELEKKYPGLTDNIPPDADAEKWDEIEFYKGQGGENGMSFVAYTENWIYFSMVYDGREYVDCIPRNPNPNWEPRHFGD